MQRKRIKWVTGFLGVILIIGLITAGCGTKAPEKETIKFGFSASLSGWANVAVETIMHPYTLWEEQINAEGGLYVEDIGKRVPVELVYYDDKSSADEVVKIYERLVTIDKVDILLSPWGTWASFPLLSLVEKYQVPLVNATCGTEEILGVESDYWWTFANWLGIVTGPATADMLSANKATIGNKVAYMGLIYPAILDFKKSFIPAAEAAGFDIVLQKDYPMEVTDLTDVLVAAKNLNPDALVVGSITADMLLIIKQSREIGFDPKTIYFFVGPGISVFFDILGEASEGITAMGHWDRQGPGPGSAEFYASYVERFGSQPDMGDTPMHWVVLQVMEQAIEKAGTLDSEEINNVIATEEFMTIMGPVKFDADQVARTGIFGTGGIGQAQGGEVKLIHPSQYASSEFILRPPWPAG
ncbi:amino acid ABC transporter substrate-binding protein [Chloroflexota bacterium]